MEEIVYMIYQLVEFFWAILYRPFGAGPVVLADPVLVDITCCRVSSGC